MIFFVSSYDDYVVDVCENVAAHLFLWNVLG
jgi:hypothetical protein